ncbi:hypothetical protein AHAS_AhasUnG0002600 [Arachis hypogaea]
MGERLVMSKAKPYLLTVGLQFGLAGTYIFSMASLNHGMSRYVFVVYRNLIAAISLAPFAFFFERKVRPKMTLSVFIRILVLGLLEPVIDQGFTFLGMQYTSASFASAIMNAVPSVTFVLAVIFRMERMKIKEVACQAKVIGTVVTFGGTLVMALYKGTAVTISGATKAAHGPENVNNPSGSHWAIGTCFLIIGCIGFSAFYILQAITLRKYPAEMSLATWVCFAGALQSSLVAAFAERHRPHAWALGWDIRLFAPAYAGIVTSGVQYYIQGMVSKAMGPVIVTAFNPLRMVIVTALACIVLSEQLYLGSVIGAIVVVGGLYAVVWGKYKEQKAKENSEQQQQLPVIALTNNDTNNKPQFLVIQPHQQISSTESQTK